MTEEPCPWTALNTRIERMSKQFEAFIGYSSATQADYEKRLAELIGAALRQQDRRVDGDRSGLVVQYPAWSGGVLNLRVDEGRAPRYGTFGLMDVGRPKRLFITNGPHLHNVFTLHAVSWPTTERVLNVLFDDGIPLWSILWLNKRFVPRRTPAASMHS